MWVIKMTDDQDYKAEMAMFLEKERLEETARARVGSKCKCGNVLHSPAEQKAGWCYDCL